MKPDAAELAAREIQKNLGLSVCMTIQWAAQIIRDQYEKERRRKRAKRNRKVAE